MAKPTQNLQKQSEETVVAQPAPRKKFVERQGASRVAYSVRWPRVIGGQCEICGVMDKNAPAEYQYKLCPHYSGMDLKCSYCDATKDPNQVNIHSRLNIAEHPDNPDKLVVWCSQLTCVQAHEKRFAPSGN